MEAINLDLLPGAMPPIVHVSQGDIGRQFQISIYDTDGSAYSLAGKDLFIVGHKGDGNVFRYPIPSSAISDNIVTITTEEQMTPVAGKVLCEISIEDNGTVLGTCNFTMDVEQGPADLGPLSESTLYIIQTLFQQAEADIAAASAAETNATASATAAHVSETNAAASATAAFTSESNAYTSAAAASTSETNAAASATAAHVSETNAATSASAAATSETNAEESKRNAQTSATLSAADEASARRSATNAANSATSAASSASDAASSASDAANSASLASTDASSASTSASNAETYASNAATSASNASDSATAAAASASSASNSANSASTSATNAASSESNAATSESNAHDSEVAAAASASSASSSASSASTSATNAAASETKIANMTVSAQSVSYTEEAEVVKTVVGDVYNLDFRIPKGQPTSGHEVIANPSGASTGGDLTKLGIDGVNYDLAGGSEIVVNPSGEVASRYINTLKIDGQTYGIPSVPVNAVNKYELSPSKLVDGNNNVLADFSGKGQTYNITGGIGTPRVVFEVCTWYVLDGEWAVKFSPLKYQVAKYIQTYNANTGRYAMQATTQPPIISKVTTPVDLGAVNCYINCLLRGDGLYLNLYNKESPILINGNAAEFYDISVRYCADNYVNGVIRNNDLKLYITADIASSVYGKTITVDYSSHYDGPTYIFENTAMTTVYSGTSRDPIITDYPTFN